MSINDKLDKDVLILKDKIEALKDDSRKLNVELCFKREQINNFKEEMMVKNEELKYYENLIKLTNKTSHSNIDDTRTEDALLLKQSDSSVDLDLEKNDFSDDQNIINQLVILLKELNSKDYELPENDNINLVNDNLMLFCNAVMVIFFEETNSSEKVISNFKIQTFKIDHKSNFVNLEFAIKEFWNIKHPNNYVLKFINDKGESVNIKDRNVTIDSFLKGKSNIKKAKFMYTDKSQKLSEDLDLINIGQATKINVKNNQENNKKVYDSSTNNFFSKFVGLSNYINDKVTRIRIKLEDKRIINPVSSSYCKSIAQRISHILHFIIIILFAYFTWISLNYKIPEDKSFFMIKTISEIFNPKNAKNKYSIKRDIIEDIVLRTEILTINKTLLSNLILVSPMRVSYVRI